MARKIPAPAAKGSLAKGNGPSSADALSDLLARAARNGEGAAQFRSDPLADVQAARAVVEAALEHGAELSRRGLPPAYGEAALRLAQQIEERLIALPAAAVAARGRSEEAADLLADAAPTASRCARRCSGSRAGPTGGARWPVSGSAS